MSDVVLIEVADGVAVVTLNRPDARNALSTEVLGRLPEAISDVDARADVAAIVLTGADPAFCAGLDLKELGSTGDNLRAGDATGDPTGQRRGPLPRTRTPVIGAVNGVAVTGGLELALACDFLVASERARFADTHSRVGVQPGWGLTVRLPAAVGLRRAKQMSATGNFIDAQTALAWGLVNHVVAHDELLPFARSLAADVAGNDPEGVAQIYRTYDEVSDVDGAEGWRVEARNAAAWLAEGFDPAEVASRRAAIQERGRTQTT